MSKTALTPNQKKENLKNRLKERFGDNYMQFMNDMSNVSFTHLDIGNKWKVNPGVISTWVKVLGYTHTGAIKQKIRVAYRIQQRVKNRDEVNKKIFQILKTNHCKLKNMM